MKVLYVTNAFPSPEHPESGVFIKSQIESLEKKGITFEVMIIRGDQGKLEYFRSIRILRTLLKNDSFDLIHCHYSYSILPALFQFKVPVVLSFMGSDLNGNYNADSLFLSRFVNMLFSNLIALKAAVIICKTEQLAGRLLWKSKVIPNGVDMDMFKPADKAVCRKKTGNSPDHRLVLFPADPVKKVKNYALAEKSVELARGKSGKNIKLLSVFGKVQEEYLDYLNAADLVLVTSLAEGSPNVVKEALACNRPVVAVDVGDVREIVSGIRNCHVTGYDPEEIAGRICEVLESDRECDGRAAIDYLREEKIAEKIINIYRRVLGET